MPGAESSAPATGHRPAQPWRDSNDDTPGQRIVAVSHGGAIGAVLAEATGSRSLAFSAADNASISHVVLHDDRWLVRRFNDTGHLAGELSTEAEAPT